MTTLKIGPITKMAYFDLKMTSYGENTNFREKQTPIICIFISFYDFFYSSEKTQFLLYVNQILLCVFYAILSLKCVIFPFLNPFDTKIGPGKCLKISRKKCEK